MPMLYILGMHRSGTSLVAQCCSAAGISAGAADELLSAQADNPEGFFENRHLVELNDTYLESCGGSWFSPPSEASTELPLADAHELLSRLSDLTADEFFLKDPRLCLTLGAWMPLTAGAVQLFVYRSPLAVARSLQKRNNFPLQLGLLLWELYNRRVLAVLATNALAISYDDVLADPTCLKDLITAVQSRGFDCNPEAITQVFNGELSHFASLQHEEAEQLLSESQRSLHQYCEAYCRGDRPVFPDLDPDSAVLARIHDLAAAFEPLARIVETGNERDEAIALVEERTEERDKTLSSIKQLQVDHQALVRAHEAERANHQHAADTLSKLANDHESLAKAHEVETSKHRELAQLHDELHEQFDSRGKELRELNQLASDLRAQKDELQDKSDYLFHELTETNKDLIRFELSFLARLQRWLRKVYRFVSGQRGKNSAYEDLLERAHLHYSSYELAPPSRPVRKWHMAGDVIRYVVRNPSGSIRSFSWARLRRACSVFFGSSAEDLSVWVNARFPDSVSKEEVGVLEQLPASLDSLELSFDSPDAPLVSIIIPVFNDYRVTMNCLQSLAEYSREHNIEVIIADDCSTDLTVSITERVTGIKVAKTERNQRFLGNCNNAAKHATGEILIFLNNDTCVTEGWLDSLLEPLTDSQVGVVGPKLLFADGKLQEAGGIIWRDASGWNFGRSDDPGKPAYNYLHDVDYVSGACLLVRHSLWRELGGFDERFTPAYYEDADLCFSARALGYRVVYQPESVVYHYEGVSNGTDLESGVKQHQVSNQAVFRDKWRAVLDAEHFENAEHVIHARDRSRHQYSVLFIDHYVPHWDKDAGSRSTFLYVKLLCDLGCRVQFMGANFFPHSPYTKTLEAMGVEVLVGESIARHLDRWLEEHAPYIDEIFLHRPHVAEQFLPHLEKLSHCPPVSFVGHDLHYLRLSREAELKNDKALFREADQWRKRELAVFDRVEKVYYFSLAELNELADAVDSTKLRCIPLYAMPSVPVPEYVAPTTPSLLFIGGYNHPPNIDAACWLADTLLPALQLQFKDIQLHLVGSNPTPAVLDLGSDSVTVHGYLSDQALAQLYREISVAVVPLRYGAGVKGKVIEAVQQGVPVVTTDVGAEGIPETERVLSIGNTDDELVMRIASLLQGDEELCRHLEQYQDWLNTHFSRQNAAKLLAEDRPALRQAALTLDASPAN